MRLALLIFALMATPVFARDVPPEQPTFEQPTFERPSTPTPPDPPNTPAQPDDDDEEPREPRVVISTPKKVSAPGLRCYFDEDGVRKVSFNTLVDPEFYKMGRQFCAKVPHKVVDVTLHCLEDDGAYRVQVSKELHSQKAAYKAKRFCICVFGLD